MAASARCGVIAAPHAPVLLRGGVVRARWLRRLAARVSAQQQQRQQLAPHRRGARWEARRHTTAPPDVEPGPSDRSELRWSVLPMSSALARLRGNVAGSSLPLLSFAGAAAAGVLGSGFQLDGPASVAEALAVLAAIIAVHEAGHFSAARLQGIHVTQFAIGFGPALVSFKVRDTILHVHLL
jgi:Peptidase family M50